MSKEFSFDVVSKVDLQAVDNAVNSSMREISTRFDFKGSVSHIELDKKSVELSIRSDNEMKLKQVIDVLQGRLVKQGVSLQSLDFKKVEPAEGASVRQKASVTQGIASEKAKELIRAVKNSKLKVQASIQGDQLRVIGKSKDDLQAAMDRLRSLDVGLPLQFVNYR